MPEAIYQKLAERLDAIPNGFPPTASGSHLRLLARMFAPEEAALATVMRLTPEPAADIAARADTDEESALRTLRGMVRKGLIRFQRGEKGLTFGLMPFVVGFYEEQLPRMDAELATLFEEYFTEVKGGSLARNSPPIHRVIPVQEAIRLDMTIAPYEQATAIIEGAKAWGVRECICRVQKRLIGQACRHPVENCLVFAPVEGYFENSKIDRPIAKEESLRILHEAEEAGLVHTTGNYRDGVHYICNCCTCSCGILRSVAEFSIPTAVARSEFHAAVDASACIGCRACVERCQFNALAITEDVCQVDEALCVGCGLCVTVCPADALSLVHRVEEDMPSLPNDISDWMAKRAQARGISLADIT